jgi:hypothetical protein
MNGPVVIDKAKCFYDEVKNMCPFSDGWLQNVKELRSL